MRRQSRGTIVLVDGGKLGLGFRGGGRLLGSGLLGQRLLPNHVALRALSRFRGPLDVTGGNSKLYSFLDPSLGGIYFRMSANILHNSLDGATVPVVQTLDGSVYHESVG